MKKTVAVYFFFYMFSNISQHQSFAEQARIFTLICIYKQENILHVSESTIAYFKTVTGSGERYLHIYQPCMRLTGYLLFDEYNQLDA